MKRIDQSTALQRVISANYALEREYTETGDPYDLLAVSANVTDTAGRLEIAAAGYLVGSRAFRGSRAFDNCFENGDGDQVVAGLVERAERNLSLHLAIAADFGGTFPASWLATADRLKAPHVPVDLFGRPLGGAVQLQLAGF